MKSILIITILLQSVGHLRSMNVLNRQSPQEEFLDKRAALVVRKIGDQLLLYSGDSTSRVLPVKQLSSGIFQLEFQSQFSFMPDTLVKIVRSDLTSIELPLDYIVNVLECVSNAVVYAFEIRPNNKEIVPCMGRAQQKGCYIIQISFIDFQTSRSSENHYPLFIFALIGLSLVTIVGRSYLKRKKEAGIIKIVDGISIGKYLFSISSQILIFNSERIELSDKETQLLTILADRQNQLISREELLKRVWEDEGVITGRSLDMFISKLRKKLKNDPSIQIINVHGKGYKLDIKPEVIYGAT